MVSDLQDKEAGALPPVAIQQLAAAIAEKLAKQPRVEPISYTIRTAAQATGLSENTIRRLYNQGTIRGKVVSGKVVFTRRTIEQLVGSDDG